MPRSSRAGELQYDPEIEKTARKLRKETNLRNKQASYSSSPESESAVNVVDSSSDSEVEGTMANEERTLRELAAPNENQQPLCIDYPTLEVAFELKSGLIHLLPTFHGLDNEDPHKHLKEFHVVCSSMRPQGVTEEQVKLRAFPFSLVDRAKDWLFYLPPGSVTTWADMVRLFLDNFFPASRAAGIRREICGIKQKDIETLHEYWEQFKRLCASCPQHGISEQLLIQYFYEGLLPMERKMMDAASGGSSSIEHQLLHLTSLVQQLVVGKTQQVKACGICAAIGHPTDMCPTLQDDSHEYANAVGRIGKELKEPSPLAHGKSLEEETEKEVVAPQTQKDQPKGLKSDKLKEFAIDPPFPSRFAKSKKEAEEKDQPKGLKNAIKQVPRYAKVLKELFTNKRKIKGNEKVSMGENISAVLQKKLPPKCKDPGMFTIPCKLGNVRIERAMLDLGASINIMPLFIYSSLNVGPLKETGVILQLADRSNVFPEGVLEDVLVQVNELVFPADFYVLDMQKDDYSKSTSILLGRTFLKIARTKIDVNDGTLIMEFDGEIIKFNIYETMRCPSDVSSVFVMDVIDPLAQETFDQNEDDKLKDTLNMNFTSEGLQGIMKKYVMDLDLQDAIQELESLKLMRKQDSNINVPHLFFIFYAPSEECAPPAVLSTPPDPYFHSVRESTQPTYSAFTPIS
ncbi:ocs element-binding factor 1-like [Hibiscus syriacus]|uniref:Ocs element-binding factor 1-like n=1 Tax=Hibiscus syriacus TaxID=106335 RepID=A0A6A2X8P8_HIBSY|nr:ocs element-binding factor 1-like [Hibiscus syriacus]